jgi:cation diffusion facilitator CzcD-associated flavoprotein CzcO
VTAIIVGAGAAGWGVAIELLAAGVTDFVILDKAPFEDTRGRDWPAALSGHLRTDCEVVGSVFDDDTDAWTLKTSADQTFRGRVVIAAHPGLFVPYVPKFNGRNDFHGVSFHAADWDPDFDPAGKRIAVVGTDATAGHYLGRLKDANASVIVFAHAPRWVVTHLWPWVPLRAVPALRSLRAHIQPTAGRRKCSVVEAAIESLTPGGIRTSDGVEHHVDAVVYGTGFQIPDQVSDEALVGAGGLTIRQAWYDGMEPYLGIAVHGFPNYFFLTGPDIGRQTRHVADCVKLLSSTGRTRIEVLRSSQQVFNERAHLEPAPLHRPVKAFDLSSGAAEDEETYDGAAVLTIAGAPHPVRVRLRGHLDPIDGRYHWQGTVFNSIPDPRLEQALKQTRAATVTVGKCSASARIVEETPWGTHSIAGVGEPPYQLTRA